MIFDEIMHKFEIQLFVIITVITFFICRTFKLDILHCALAHLYWVQEAWVFCLYLYGNAGGEDV